MLLPHGFGVFGVESILAQCGLQLVRLQAQCGMQSHEFGVDCFCMLTNLARKQLGHSSRGTHYLNAHPYYYVFLLIGVELVLLLAVELHSHRYNVDWHSHRYNVGYGVK